MPTVVSKIQKEVFGVREARPPPDSHRAWAARGRARSNSDGAALAPASPPRDREPHANGGGAHSSSSGDSPTLPIFSNGSPTRASTGSGQKRASLPPLRQNGTATTSPCRSRPVASARGRAGGASPQRGAAAPPLRADSLSAEGLVLCEDKYSPLEASFANPRGDFVQYFDAPLPEGKQWHCFLSHMQVCSRDCARVVIHFHDASCLATVSIFLYRGLG